MEAQSNISNDESKKNKKKESYFTKSDKIKMGLVVLGLVVFALSPLIFGWEIVMEIIENIFGVIFVIFFIVVIAVPWAIDAISTNFK